MKPDKNQRCRAFTLVEIMVAIAIFGMIVTAIYSTWVLILKSARVGQEAAAQIQRERITIRMLEDSLTCVQSFQSSMKYYSFIVQNGEEPILSFTARLPENYPRNGRFGDFNLRRLTFTVEPGPDSEKDLVLRQNPILMDVDADEQSNPLVLARNVKDFVVECWDTNTVQWVDQWDDTNSIPAMLRVNLVLGGNADSRGAGSTLSITRLIAMPSITLPSAAQTSSSLPGGGGGINLPPPGGSAPGNNPNPNNPNTPNPKNQRNPFDRGQGGQR